MLIMMSIKCIVVLLVVTTDTAVGQALFEHSLLLSAFPTNVSSTNNKHIYIINGDPAGIYIIHSTDGDLYSRSLSLSNPLSRVLSMDTDYERRKLYIHELRSSAIYGVSGFNWETSFQGMSISTIHSGISKSSAVKIAVDWVSDNVYWVDPVFRWIAVQSGNLQIVDQSKYKILVYKNLRYPSAIAVDPVHWYMFWTDVGSVVKIERSNLIGENKATIVSTGLAYPSAIDVDLTSSEIFWVDHIRDTIEGADFNGDSRRTVRRMANTAFSDLVVLGGIITVSDYASGRFHLINKQTGEIHVQGLGASSGDKFWGLGLYTPNSQPSKPDSCLNKGCSDLCVNMPTAAQCLCREGYQLNTDGRTCNEVEGDYHRALVVAGSRSICLKDIRSVASSLHGVKANCFLNVTGEDISYFDIDMINRKIYYAANMKIYSKIIGDTGAPVQLVALTDTLTGLSLNWRDENIYWSMGEGGQGRIQLFSQSTMSTYTILDTNLYNPRELIILPLDRLMVWINGYANNYKIEKAAMDGSNRETVVEPASLSNPVSVTIDPTTHIVYWTDSATIKKANLDGTDIDTLDVNTLSTHLVTVYKNHLIFTENTFSGSRVKSGDMIDMDPLQSDFTVPEVGTVMCIKALDAHLQPSTKGPCDVLNGGCEHICLPIGETKLCRCEYGFTLDANRQTCSSTLIEDNFLIVTDSTHDKIYQVSFDNGNAYALDTNEISNPTGIAFNQKTKQLIWGDSSQNIHRINLNGTGYELLGRLESIKSHPDRFAIDHSTGNVFYTSVPVVVSGVAGVGVLSPDGKRHTLIRRGSIPRDIVLDPENGYLFWSDHSAPPFVNRAYMDGTSITTIISSNIVWPNGLAIDGQENRLYVTDGYLNTIQKCTYGGACSQIYQSLNAHLMDGVLLGNYLYYTAWNKQYITKLNKDDTTDSEMLARKSEFGRLDALIVYRSSVIPYTESAFCSQQNGACSTFCFPKQGGRVCGCEDGVSLRSDGQSCTNVYGVFGEWTAWNPCTVSCGTGSKSRSRECTYPGPLNGIVPCIGNSIKTNTCNTQPCPIIGCFSEWTVWGSCIVSCGTGIQSRSRDCTDPVPQYGVDGGFTAWTTWGSCPVTCGTGSQTRSRACTNPAPRYGGSDCVGESKQTQGCNNQSCPIDGGFTAWTSWGSCPVTCGTGSQTRSRECTNPVPRYGGSDCVGESKQTQGCNNQSCPIDGGFTAWTTWGLCPVTCGTGSQTRSRECTNPVPRYGGSGCVGESKQTQGCNNQSCPIDGGFTAWTSWGSCPVTCGTGSQTRSRECTNPVPRYGGSDCVGESKQTQGCNNQSCPIDGGFTAWTTWGLCPVTCGTGSQTRSRECTNPVPRYGGSGCVGESKQTQGCNNQSCPIDGGFTAWTSWGSCLVTCGTGSQTRSRECTNPVPRYGGSDCVGESKQTQGCNNQSCPIDGGFTAWTTWGLCPVTCGTGSQTRSRECTNPVPRYGGSGCVGESKQTQGCNNQSCPIDGGFTAWTSWGSCLVTCGTGSQTRSRECTNPVPRYGGSDCVGESKQTQGCNNQSCPIDGGFTAWTTWGLCPVTCGTGSQTRSRECTNPVPRYGGSGCVGESKQTQGCNNQSCPIDGGFTAWTSWGSCLVTCGTGSQTRSRECTNPVPRYGGSDCVGESKQTQGCNNQSCPIDGGFTAWTTWGLCPVTCGTGSQTRSRECTNPVPRYGGSGCVGESKQTQGCNNQSCPIDGGFTAWTSWGSCPVTCGTGSQTRSRECTNPVPRYGGSDCVGESKQTQGCNNQSCPIDGGFTAWTTWGLCPVTCGTGSQTRSRECTNPVPRYGGSGCVGESKQTQGCNNQSCPIDGGFTAWTSWGSCPVTCGTGSQTRSRECTNPAPRYGGSDCVGESKQTQGCNNQSCPIDGGFTVWTTWGSCPVTCGTGHQSRSRECTNPTPQYGGSNCVGDSTESQDCNTQPCPIDGGFNIWTAWGSCTESCGIGRQSRSRDCTKPAPQYGGSDCVGESTETQDCSNPTCRLPVNGGFSEWTVWGSCTVSCETGSQSRSRDCTDPVPQYGGSDCMGASEETKDCNTQICPIDGGFTAWTTWGSCPVTCGTGHQSRSRDCTNPTPQYGGSNCVGDSTESQDCNTQPCPATPTATKSSVVDESSGEDTLPVAMIAGPVAGGGGVLIIIIIVLIILLKRRGVSQSISHGHFPNPAFDPHPKSDPKSCEISGDNEPEPDPYDNIFGDNRPDSVEYDQIGQLERPKIGEIREDDARKSTNLYIYAGLSPSSEQTKRDDSTMDMTQQQGPLSVEHDYQILLPQVPSNQNINSSIRDETYLTTMPASIGNELYQMGNEGFEVDEDRMSPKLPRNPRAIDQDDQVLLQPFRQSDVSVGEDYMIPVTARNQNVV